MGKHKKSAWRRGADLKADLIQRCDAYCAATDTPLSFLSIALCRNGATIKRLREGGDIGTRVYDSFVTGLARLEALVQIAPDGRDWPRGDDLVQALIQRCEGYCEATGVRPTRLDAAIGAGPGLVVRLKDNRDIQLDRYDAYMTALDKIADTLLRAFGHNGEEDHDGETQ